MTEKADKAIGSLLPKTTMEADPYSIQLLVTDLNAQKENLDKAIESDSYKRVKVSEKIIVNLCESINALRDVFE